MNFFRDEDFEKVINQNEDDIPDGLIDGGSYVDLFENVVNDMSMLDLYDDKSRVFFMMRIINHVDLDREESIYELASALCYHLISLIGIGEQMRDGFMKSYIDSLINEVIPGLRGEMGGMPYWE
jgi:hypothetical protein